MWPFFIHLYPFTYIGGYFFHNSYNQNIDSMEDKD